MIDLNPRSHLIVADRLMVQWASRARSSAHPWLDDSSGFAVKDDGDRVRFGGYSLRCSLRRVRDPLGFARLVFVGWRGAHPPSLWRSPLTRRGRAYRRMMRRPIVGGAVAAGEMQPSERQ